MKKEIKQKLVFNGATFKKRADFKKLIFTQDTDFSNARFEDNVYFNKAEFKKEADFHESEYERVACFYGVRFEKIPNFSSAIFFANSKLNLINSTLSKPSYSFEDLKEKIEEKISKPKDFNSKEFRNKERRKLKREWLKERDKLANDYRDSFRTLKNALLKDNNLLDAQDCHYWELYCKEIELSNAMEKMIPADKHLESEIKGVNFNIHKFKEWIDSLHLALYRNLCDHHSNLLKIVNNLMILVALFVVFTWGLKELSLVGTCPNRVSEMLYDTTIAEICDFFNFKNNFQIKKIEPQSLLHICVMVAVVSVLFLFFVVCVFLKTILEICKSQFLKRSLTSFVQELFSLLKYFFFCILFLFALGNIPVLSMEKMLYIASFSLSFVILFVWLISLKTLIIRYLVVLFAYFGFFYTLCNQPLLISPFVGGLLSREKELPIIFQNPIFITLTIVYSFLMFLLLFSLQKTARKNSIIPT